jgi:hypothetical protein
VGRNLDPADVVTFTTPGRIDPLTGSVAAGPGGRRLTINLPAGLRPGVNTVRLTRPAPVTSPPSCSPHVLSQSNAAPFLLRPSVVSIGPASPPEHLQVVVSPPVGPRQQVSLLLNRAGGVPPLAFTLGATPHPTETDTLSFDLSNFPGGAIPTGRYLARVRVDEAESRLDVDAFGRYVGPLVIVP